MHSFQQMAKILASCIKTLDKLIEDCRFTHTIHATKDINPSIKIPLYVLCATPKRIDLYLSYIISVLLHDCKIDVVLQR